MLAKMKADKSPLFYSTKGDALAIDPDVQSDYLQRNIGWSLTKNRDNYLAMAIDKPSEFIAARNTLVDELFVKRDNKGTANGHGPVTEVFQSYFKKFREAGFPDDLAREKAIEIAREEYNRSLQLLELQSPGAYNAAFGGARIQQDARTAIVNVATDPKPHHENVQAYKRYKKAKKQAKKAKRV